MLELPMSIIWFRLLPYWRSARPRPSLPDSPHLRRDLNLPPSEPSPHWRDLLP